MHALRRAVREVRLVKRATCHTLRRSFVTHLLEDSHEVRTIQELLDHKDVRTTMMYTHVLNCGDGVRSPAGLIGDAGYPASLSARASGGGGARLRHQLKRRSHLARLTDQPDTRR